MALTADDGSVRSRYPGSPPFEDSELDRRLFNGREQDSAAVLHSILGHDLFVLYARSGIGKTSLLKAGVASKLRRQDFCPVMVRLSDPSQRPVDSVRAALLQLEKDSGLEMLGVEAECTTLTELMSGLEIWREDTLQMPILIFDQFEELFTLWDEARRQEFIAEFAELVRPTVRVRTGDAGPVATDLRPRVKVVLALREDFLGHLEAFSTDIPLILAHRYRLQPLTRTQAREAIEKPAQLSDEHMASRPFRYESSATDTILDFLTRRTDGQSGDGVEAFQLQIICRYIEDQVVPRLASEATVTVEDFGGASGLTTIFSDFYQREIDQFDSRRARAKIRDFCETKLISPSGRRVSLEREQIVVGYGVTEEQLETLVRRRVVRAEPRLNTFYYELAHDSLVQPILDDRAERLRRQRVLAVRIGAAVAAIAIVILAAIAWTRGGESNTDTISVSADGQVVSESLDAPGDADVFEIDTGEGDVYLIVVEPTGNSVGLDAQVDPGEALALLDQRSSEGVVTARLASLESGGRRITVRSSSGANGEYEISVRSITPLAPTEDDGGNIEVDDPGEIDIVRIPGEAAQVVSVKVNSSEDFEAQVALVDSSGTPLVSTDQLGRSTDNLLVRELDGVAPYFAVIRHVAERPTEYEIDVELSVVQDLESELVGPADSSGSIDVFRITAANDQVAEIRIDPQDAPLGGVVEVLNAESRSLGRAELPRSGSPAAVTVALPTAGTYTVAVRDTAADADYTLEAGLVDAVALEDAELPHADETDREPAYTFEGVAGALVELTMTPASPLDAVFEVIGPGLTAIERVDVRGPREAENATIVLPTTGTYVVRPSGARDTEGSYELLYDQREVEELPDEGSASGSIDDGSEVATYGFSAVAGEAVTLTLTSPAGDLNGVLEVIDSSSNRVALADLGGEGAPETVTVIPQQTSSFVTFVGGFGDSIGDYEIMLQRPGVHPLEIGTESESSEIEDTRTGTDVDVFSFTASAGEALAITMSITGDLDGQFSVVDSEAQSIAVVNYENVGGSESISLTIPDDGRYFILARGVERSSGTYRLRLERSSPTTLDGENLEAGTIGPDEIHAFQFTAPADSAVTLNLDSSNGLDGLMDIWDPSSNRIARVDNATTNGLDTRTFVLDRGGTYLVTVRGYEGSEGDYAISLRSAQTTQVEGNQPGQYSIDSPGEVDVFRFAATAGDSLAFRMLSGPELDGAFRVVRPDGVDFAAGGAGAGTAPLISTTALGGEYLVFVGGNNTTGSYEFVITVS